MKRLSLIKRLASTSWGSDMDTLRSLYLGYVRSVIYYNLCLQASSSKTVQSEIDRVQNHALRFICGGMRSTPTAACEIHVRIEPLGLRRKKLLWRCMKEHK
ncbi:reverse transcriptase-like protein [Elysia marginata]|uniref:Reverse transcriptase-like protein n=1 Tax=Elysia marginata TaxID=1093978 RepID=A0AAV4J0M3_9GAST|nr:reverse transcriptase-like protein [Elysia marginata]